MKLTRLSWKIVSSLFRQPRSELVQVPSSIVITLPTREAITVNTTGMAITKVIAKATVHTIRIMDQNIRVTIMAEATPLQAEATDLTKPTAPTREATATDIMAAITISMLVAVICLANSLRSCSI